MQSIDSVLLLSHALSMTQKAVRNAKKLYMQMCVNVEEKHRDLIQMCSDENKRAEKEKIKAEVENLLLLSVEFAKKVALFFFDFLKKMNKFEKIDPITWP